MLLRALVVGLVVGGVGCIEQGQIVLEPDPDGLVRDAAVGAPDAGPGVGALVVTPPSLVFEAAGERRVVTLANGGDAPLTIARLRRVGDPAVAFTIDGENALLVEGLVVEAGRQVNVMAEALVAPADGLEAALEVESDDPARGVVVVPIALTPALCLRAWPGALDFRDVRLGTGAQKTVLLSNCGSLPLSPRGLALVDGGVGFELRERAAPPAVLAPGASFEVEVRFEALVPGPAHDTVLVEFEELSETVPLSARATEATCPVPTPPVALLTVRPEEVFTLDAAQFLHPIGRAEARYGWTVVERPAGSVALPVEGFFDPVQPGNGGSDDDTLTPEALMFVDLPGRYRFELQYRDLFGCTVEVDFVVDACPCEGEGVMVELSWQTPDDPVPGDAAGADMDLHLRHPNAAAWFTHPYDCYFQNPRPDWGQLGNPADDCLLVTDVIGAGTETLTLEHPENTETLGQPYLVGVDFYGYRDMDPPEEPQAIEVAVRVWARGELTYEGQRALMIGDLWIVGALEWPAGDVIRLDVIERAGARR